MCVLVRCVHVSLLADRVAIGLLTYTYSIGVGSGGGGGGARGAKAPSLLILWGGGGA